MEKLINQRKDDFDHTLQQNKESLSDMDGKITGLSDRLSSLNHMVRDTDPVEIYQNCFFFLTCSKTWNCIFSGIHSQIISVTDITF